MASVALFLACFLLVYTAEMTPYKNEADAIGILGTGRVAKALGRLLRQAGMDVACVYGRDPARTQAAAAFIGGAQPASLQDLVRRTSRYLIAVSDSAIPELAAQIAACGPGPGIALHTSGGWDVQPLRALHEAGVSCGTLHPFQTVSTPEQGVHALRGCAYAISGEPAALAWAKTIVRNLNGMPLPVLPAARPLYHVAGVLASNYIVALLHAAQALLEQAAGLSAEEALRALAPLVRNTVANVLKYGPETALTGPIERGDAETVRAHLEALNRAASSLTDLYRAAGLHTLEITRRKRHSTPNLARMEEVLHRTGLP